MENRLLFSKRLNLALICFLGCAIAYTLRSNLSFAIVCMVTDDSGGRKQRTSGCNSQNAAVNVSTLSNANNISDLNEAAIQKEFTWSKGTQGTVLSAFFWGYIASNIFGGYLSSLIGAKRVILGAIFLSSALTLAAPQAARLSVVAFIASRVLIGFTQGSLFPAMHSLWSNWAPPLERGLLTGVSYAGCQIGNVLVMPLSGFLCNYGIDGGWPSIFYLLGILGLFWCILWATCTAEKPNIHGSISEGERRYIVESLGGSDNKESDQEKSKKIPFVKMLTSPAIWAIFVGHFAGDWGAYTMAVGLPSFMNDILGLDLTSMGMLSAVPYIFYFVVINLGGFVADYMQNSGFLSTLNTRRLAMIIALCGQAFFLLLIGYSNCGDQTLVIVLLTLSVGISGFQYSGFVVNYLDVCPKYAGVALGIGNTLSCLAGVLSPIIMGKLTQNGTKDEWLNVFYLTSLILVVGTVLFCVFASGEIQPWASESEKLRSNLPAQLDKPLLTADEDVEKEKQKEP